MSRGRSFAINDQEHFKLHLEADCIHELQYIVHLFKFSNCCKIILCDDYLRPLHVGQVWRRHSAPY